MAIINPVPRCIRCRIPAAPEELISIGAYRVCAECAEDRDAIVYRKEAEFGPIDSWTLEEYVDRVVAVQVEWNAKYPVDLDDVELLRARCIDTNRTFILQALQPR